ncbi:hypothetical protein A0H81_12298 [Grifola frondosa]|uniref:Uncharacterized protein n=1 Tax=Grifola frondosa TaxID=5627 RepID=A0A1C7LTD3_GRIFR|nr:hypothetical protein A0H81_12298 [Grifola frondosa]
MADAIPRLAKDIPLGLRRAVDEGLKLEVLKEELLDGLEEDDDMETSKSAVAAKREQFDSQLEVWKDVSRTYLDPLVEDASTSIAEEANGILPLNFPYASPAIKTKAAKDKHAETKRTAEHAEDVGEPTERVAAGKACV